MARKPISYKASRVVKERTVAEFERQMDPQRWEDNVPALWYRSHLVDGALPADRSQEPARKGRQPEFDDELFFEYVTVPLLAYYRNILKTTLKKELTTDGTLRRIEFEYRQFDCLEGEFLGNHSLGSIDVDHGGAVCEQLDNGDVKIEISKTVRFTQPKAMLDFVDVFSRVAVQLVFELLLVGLDLEYQQGASDA